MLTAAPEKSRLPKFAVVESPKVTSNPVDTIVPNPATVTAPLSVSTPPVVTVRFWPTPTVPRSNAFASVRATSLLPLLLRLTAPVKSLPAFVKVIAFAPAVTLAVESASIAPLCVTAPLATKVNAPVASEAATSIALASVMLTAAPEKSRLPKLAVVLSPKVTD